MFTVINRCTYVINISKFNANFERKNQLHTWGACCILDYTLRETWLYTLACTCRCTRTLDCRWNCDGSGSLIFTTWTTFISSSPTMASFNKSKKNSDNDNKLEHKSVGHVWFLLLKNQTEFSIDNSEWILSQSISFYAICFALRLKCYRRKNAHHFTSHGVSINRF